MILAHPDSDLQKNLMVVSADILLLLSSKNRIDNFVLIEDVMEEFLKQNEKRSPDMFLNSLAFLFCFGIIEKNQYKIKLLKKTNQKSQTQLF